MLITGTAPPLTCITSCTVCHSNNHNGNHSGNTLCPPPNEWVLCTLRLSRLSKATLHVAIATLRAVVVGLRFAHIAARSDTHAWQRRVANLQHGGLDGGCNTLRHKHPPRGFASAKWYGFSPPSGALCSQPNEVVNLNWAIYSQAGPNVA